MGSSVEGIDLYREMAFLVDTSGDCSVLDISDPSSPTLIARARLAGDGKEVNVSDSIVCAGMYDGGLWLLRYNGPYPSWSRARETWQGYR
jgi:hypothetical protein